MKIPVGRSLVVLLVGLSVVTALAACQSDNPKPTPSTAASATTPPPVPSVEPDAVTFVTPTTCTQLLGTALEQQFLAHDVLFSGPGGSGLYPDASIAQDGGTPVACRYGRDMVDLSTYEIAAQPLTEDAHEGTVAELDTRGYVKKESGDTITYSQVGDEGTTPAIVHVVTPTGWVSAWSSFGGAERLSDLITWVSTVEKQVYPAS